MGVYNCHKFISRPFFSIFLLQDELHNLEEIVIENECEKEEIKEYLSEKQPIIEKEESEDELDRGTVITVIIPYLKGFSGNFQKNNIKTWGQNCIST